MTGERGADVWLPLHFDPRENDRRDWRGFYAVGRLAPGITLDVARQELGVIRQELMEEHPEELEHEQLVSSAVVDRFGQAAGVENLYIDGHCFMVLGGPKSVQAGIRYITYAMGGGMAILGALVLVITWAGSSGWSSALPS